MAQTKNLGQVSGIHIGTVPPTNTQLIWYDETVSQRCHKVYDYNLLQWVIIDQKVISNITYLELTNLASSVGLPLGKFYRITDKADCLAVSVTSTKVFYFDAKGNLLVDDLGSNIQVHVSSSNLQIDGLAGTYNESNSTLSFSFGEYTPANTDYFLGKVIRNGINYLAKFKLTSLISTQTGNSLVWNGNGFYFNFVNALKAVLDKTGGVVGYNSYTSQIQSLNTQITNISSNYQNLLDYTSDLIDDRITDNVILGKKLLTNPDVSQSPTDISSGDSLTLIISKIQRWINSLKLATGIKISSGFTLPTAEASVAVNDTVETAIAKLQYSYNNINISESLKLPSNWTSNPTVTEINLSPTMTFAQAFAILQGKFNHIGTIVKNSITSKATTIRDAIGNTVPTVLIDMAAGSIKLNNEAYASNYFDSLFNKDGLVVENKNILNSILSFSNSGFKVSTGTNQNSYYWENEETKELRSGSYVHAKKTVGTGNPSMYAAFTAAIEESLVSNNSFDAFFNRLKVGNLTGHAQKFSLESQGGNETRYIYRGTMFVVVLPGPTASDGTITLNLPSNPSDGTFIFISCSKINVLLNGNGAALEFVKSKSLVQTISTGGGTIQLNTSAATAETNYLCMFGSSNAVYGWRVVKISSNVD